MHRASCATTFESEDLSHWEKAFAGFEGVWDVMHTAHEVHSDPQAIANGYLPRATDAQRQRVRPGRQPGAVRRDTAATDRAPGHGEHTDALLAELGFSEEEIIDFKVNSVVL